MAHLTEIVLIVLIVAIVFGMGRLPQIATSIGKRRHKSQHEGPKTIDITPDAGPKSPSGRKPGKFERSVEDAHIEET